MEKSKKDRVKRRVSSVLRGTCKVWRGKQTARRKRTEKPSEPELCKVTEEIPSNYSTTVDTDMVDLPQPEKDETSPTEMSPAVEGITSASDDQKLIKDMPPEAYQKLVELLQPKSVIGRDYRLLASRLGFPNDYIQWLGSTSDPVVKLVKACGDRKITELESIVKDMGRPDVLQDLQPFKDNTLTQTEIEARQQTFEKNEGLQTLRESYDAFVCFVKDANEDRKFVEKLVQKMEGPPFNLHLCRSDRDFLGGGCFYENAATVIAERCKKCVVILSTNFSGNEEALFETYSALSLKPGIQDQRIIPILMEENYRYKIPHSISHITYHDFPRAEGDSFWERLATSLGWIKPR